MEDRFKFRTFYKPTKVMEYNGLWSGKDWDRKVNDTNFILMQCTGLKDKNGKLIYEGDIVKVFHVSSSMQGKLYHEAVIYNPNKARYEVENMGAFYEDDLYEVIGNIYENPELLKEIN